MHTNIVVVTISILRHHPQHMLDVAPLGGYTSATLLSAPKHVPLTLTLTAHGRRTSVSKNPGETAEHLVLKVLLWALLLPTHPSVEIERDLGLRYRPDVVALDDAGSPEWWCECGSVKASKLGNLASAFPRARISVAKWGRGDLRGYAGTLKAQLPELPPTVDFDLISFPADSCERFISDEGELSIAFDDLDVVPLHVGQEG